MSKHQIIWGGNYFPLPPSQYFCIWDKGESIYGRSFAEGEFAWVDSGGTRIFKFPPNQLDRIHVAQKPVPLYIFCLQQYAKPGYKIFDSHVGSGSSRIACYDLGFDFWGCEKDKYYWGLQEDRFNKYLSQPKLFDTNEVEYKQEDLF